MQQLSFKFEYEYYFEYWLGILTETELYSVKIPIFRNTKITEVLFNKDMNLAEVVVDLKKQTYLKNKYGHTNMMVPPGIVHLMKQSQVRIPLRYTSEELDKLREVALSEYNAFKISDIVV